MAQRVMDALPSHLKNAMGNGSSGNGSAGGARHHAKSQSHVVRPQQEHPEHLQQQIQGATSARSQAAHLEMRCLSCNAVRYNPPSKRQLGYQCFPCAHQWPAVELLPEMGDFVATAETSLFNDLVFVTKPRSRLPPMFLHQPNKQHWPCGHFELIGMDDDQQFENTSTSVAASQMRNSLNSLADTVTDPAEKKVISPSSTRYIAWLTRL